MECLGSGKGVFSRLADKTANGTAWLRVSVALLIVSSTVSAMLYVGVLGLDDAFLVQNNQNVYYTNSALTAASGLHSEMPRITERRTLLFPQLRASIGFHTVCVGRSCFPRSHLSGVSSLVANAAQGVSELHLPERLAAAYEEATYEYIFGFDIGTHCGTSRAKTQSLSNLVVAASALALVLLLALFSASMFLSLLVVDTTLLVHNTRVDRELHLVAISVQAPPALYLMNKVSRHLQWKRPLLLSAFLLSLLLFVTSVVETGAVVALNRSLSKCGQPVCVAFEEKMDNVYKVAESFGVKLSTPRHYSCRNGDSHNLVIAALCLSALCLIMSGVMLLCYHRSSLHAKMTALRSQLRGMVATKKIAGAESSVTVPLQGVSALIRTSSTTFIAGPASGQSSGASESTSKRLCLSPTVDGLRRACSVGSCIELYRQLKHTMALEEESRWHINTAERIEFQACVALRETMWFGEAICRLHKRMLDCFAGPALALCMLETRRRHRLLHDYEAGVTAVLVSLGDGAGGTLLEPAPRRGEGAGVREENGTLWEQRLRRLREVQAQMRDSFHRTASYVDAGPIPRRSAFSSVQPKPAACVKLDIDGWVGRLKDLYATHVDEPFSVNLFAEVPLGMRSQRREAVRSITLA
ncbi:hypothetical protein LSCM1_00098 [Leishmania martiniquensis]|uniref:Uncharacterized protein n=1 Tax=Leishmania martiniquensis TaxID=1580590 RepID=A0A836KAP8_9TRYP|nr:hypothetical protein LSCM1_00098 [Leishmania martiniquensis]